MSTINLLPDDYLKRRGQRRSNMVCMVLFAVVLSGVIGANAVTSQSERHTLQIRDRINEEYAQATKLIKHMQSLGQQRAVMVQKGQVTASLVERMPRSTVLGTIVTACPEGVSLTEVSLLCKAVKSNTPAPTGRGVRRSAKSARRLSTVSRKAGSAPEVEVAMTIAGLAKTDTQVAKFIANLAASRPLIKDVNLVFSQEKLVVRANTNKTDVDKDAKVLVREFEVKLQLAPEADALEMVKTVIERARAKGRTGPDESSQEEAVG